MSMALCEVIPFREECQCVISRFHNKREYCTDLRAIVDHSTQDEMGVLSLGELKPGTSYSKIQILCNQEWLVSFVAESKG
jgi:hypothetical protein